MEQKSIFCKKKYFQFSFYSNRTASLFFTVLFGCFCFVFLSVILTRGKGSLSCNVKKSWLAPQSPEISTVAHLQFFIYNFFNSEGKKVVSIMQHLLGFLSCFHRTYTAAAIFYSRLFYCSNLSHTVVYYPKLRLLVISRQ
jgi:hypothetical protein